MRRWEARKQAQRQAEEEAKSGYKRLGGLGRSYQPLIDETDEEKANELISFDSAEVQSAAQMATELRNITDKCEELEVKVRSALGLPRRAWHTSLLSWLVLRLA